MTTLTKSKSDMFRLFEQLGSADPIKLTRVLAGADAWPKSRGTPNPDHVAALTIAAMLPVPVNRLGPEYEAVASLPLADIRAYTSNAQGQLVGVDLEAARNDVAVFLIKKNMPTVLTAVRYLLGEVAGGAYASNATGQSSVRRPDLATPSLSSGCTRSA